MLNMIKYGTQHDATVADCRTLEGSVASLQISDALRDPARRGHGRRRQVHSYPARSFPPAVPTLRLDDESDEQDAAWSQSADDCRCRWRIVA